MENQKQVIEVKETTEMANAQNDQVIVVKKESWVKRQVKRYWKVGAALLISGAAGYVLGRNHKSSEQEETVYEMDDQPEDDSDDDSNI
jgi:DNA-binding IclR family transcriptional regulator